MPFGKATMNVPPAATSHTSCQLHSGPIAATTSRRSAPVLATIRCNAPAPKSQPSRTANRISVKLKIPNHSSIMGSLRVSVGRVTRFRVGTALHLVPDQIQVQKPEHEVDPGQADQREQHVAAAHHRARAVACPK